MSAHAGLLEFVDQLRAKGVRTYKGPFDDATVELELGPAVEAEAPQSTTKQPELDLCHCKCPVYAHQGGLCLHGCEPALCAGPEATP